MKQTTFSLFFAFLSFTAAAQLIIQKDNEIEGMIRQVSPDSLQSYIKNMVAFGTRNTLSNQASGSRGIGAAKKWVLAKFNQFIPGSKGRLSAFIDTTTLPPDGRRVDRPVLLGNVVAILKGTDPEDKRIFIISGHLDNMRSSPTDSIGDAPGANDDASGCAAVIECARVLSKYEFPATIVFVTVSGEEQGLLGANFMSEKAKKENWQIEAVLNNDIIGSNNSNETNIIDNTKIRVFSEGLPAFETEKTAANIRMLGLENDGRARQLARYVKEIGERYVENLQVVMIYRNDRFLRGGDHTPYVQRGFAAVRFTEMNENFTRQHQNLRTENGIEYGDLEKHIDYEYLRKNTAMNLANLASLAKAPAVPDSVKMDVKRLGNSTRLLWNKPKTGKVKGYYILLRETTSAVWQKKIFIAQTEAVLPYSKDNYFFAVQSVNETGNESLPVVPGISGR
jgi:Peptidase family M28